MRNIKIILMGILGVCLMSGCTKGVQVTKEIRRQQINELMINSEAGNVSVEESPSGTYMCGIDYETNHLVILDEKGKVVINTDLVSPIDENLYLGFYAWANEQEWLWLVHNRTHEIKDFLKIDLTTGTVTYFEQNYGFLGEYALEPNTGYLCFSNAPAISDTDAEKAFVESNQEVTLKLANLFEEDEVQIIETANGRAFNPNWIEPYTLTYSNTYLGIDEIEKATYAFNQSYELLPAITEPIVYETDELYMEKCKDILGELQTSGKQSKEVVTLYGYTMPIKDITVLQENDGWINDEGYIRCVPAREDLRLYLYIDDRQVKDCTVLADFFGLKYDERTVKWLMDKFINERHSYIAFEDGSYIRFSMTTAGFKVVSIGIV
ncbi:MAG TPA: hypothetical protein GX707_20300 [Epulopiscium sp.]|nr:hypothetical protein [Candidatus Epulonipiscium sp.]